METDGKMPSMPPRVRIDLPSQVSHVVDGLGIAPVRLVLLAELAHHGTGTIPGMAESLGLSTQLVSHHLRAMESAGLVSADRQSRGRGGHVVTWRVDITHLNNQLDAIRNLFH
mgnify:CR=1 FL=1